MTMMQANYRPPFGAPRIHFDESAAGAGGGAAAGGAAGGASAAAGSGTPVWHEGKVDAETVGFWQNKGYDVSDPVKVASELTKQYRAAEKFLGAPADQIVRLPKADAKPEDLRAFYQRLGAPAEAKDYDFAAIKDSAGNAISAPLADALRAAAFDRGLSKDAATTIAQSVVKTLDGIKATETAERTAKIAESKAELAKNWGANFDYNRLKAMDGARRLGIDQDTVATFENLMGYAGIMETLRKIGAGTSEDTFVERGTGSNGNVTTREGAISRKAELMADGAWATRYLSGDVAAKREMDAINIMIDGVAA